MKGIMSGVIKAYIRSRAYALSPFSRILAAKFALSLELGQPHFLGLKLILARDHLKA
jgi:hypothetical protein